MIQLYTDGSCHNYGCKSGGWAYAYRHQGELIKHFGKVSDTTNNRMEIMGALEGLKSLKDGQEVEVFSDSQYVVNTMMRGWKRKKNNDLWDQLDLEVKRLKVKFTWVRGHAGNEMNEICDSLCSYKS
jgi:ribonuclease HI